MGKSSVFKLISLLLFLSMVVIFAGCGGGGGGGDSHKHNSSTYSISGTVSGTVSEGVTITLLTDDGSQTTTTDSDGNYTFSDLESGSYNISASMTDYSFAPTIKSVSVHGADVPGIDFVSSDVAATTYKLFPDGFLTAAYTESYDLTGSSSTGGTYTATLDVTTESETTFDGDATMPVEHELHLTNTITHISGTLTSTDYHTTSLDDHEYLGLNNSNYGSTVSATSVFAIPRSASIGDSGSIGIYTYSNGYKQTLSWELTDAVDDYATLVITSVIKTGSGSTVSTEESSYVIDEDGIRYAVTVVLHTESSGLTITLSGDL
jgi:hypothetical protein